MVTTLQGQGTKTAPKFKVGDVVLVKDMTKAKAIRVTIQCQDCGADREIATQDRFQVKRCAPCQLEHRKLMRKLNRKTTIERLKERIAELEEGQ